MAAIALDFHELALKQSSLKVRQLYMRRRLRRLELAALKAEFGEEPGTEAAVETELEEGEEGGEPAAAGEEGGEKKAAEPAVAAAAKKAAEPAVAAAAEPVAAAAAPAAAAPAAKRRRRAVVAAPPDECRACANMALKNSQGGYSHLRRPPCKLGPRPSDVAKAKAKAKAVAAPTAEVLEEDAEDSGASSGSD